MITEVDQGIFTGRQKGSFSKEEQQLRAKRSAECGMENFDELKVRCQKFLEFLRLKPYKTILVVTHNAVASVLEDLLNNKNMDYSHITGWNFKNAEIKSFNL